MSRVASILEAAGMSSGSTEAKQAVFGRLERALATEMRKGSDASWKSGPSRAASWFVPGRIEVLGKHTDYAGGRSLLCAAERGFCVRAVGREDRRIDIVDVGRGTRTSIELDPDLPRDAGDWSLYVRTVARRVARNFPHARHGATVVFESDLPSAAGMSSSSALMIALFLVLADVNGLRSDAQWASTISTPEDLAGYLAAVENGSDFATFGGDRGVGTAGGSEDHTAILCCRAGRATQYAFCPVRFERAIVLDGDHLFAIASSGVHAKKTGLAREQYNRASQAAMRILELWRRSTGVVGVSLGAVLRGDASALEHVRETIRATVPDPEAAALLNRLEQFHEESELIVPAAGDALAGRDFHRFGAIVERSQALAERLLGNQVDETIGLARLARAHGALAASAFGAGYGGSVWAMVTAPMAPEFLDRWAAAYREAFPAAAPRASFFLTQPGPAATRLDAI